MAIFLYCKACKTDNDPGAKACKKCQSAFPSKGRKYRVRIKKDGHAVNRFTHSLDIARDLDTVIAADLVRGKYGIYKKQKSIVLGAMLERYLAWAKDNKKTWLDDKGLYDLHIGPTFGHLPMDKVTPLAIERLKSDLKKAVNRRGVPYAPATIKHVLIVIRRLFNLARKWGLYDGENPMSKVSMPKVDNTVVRFLSDAEFARLTKILDDWPCRDSVDIVRFAMLTGFRQSEVLGLKWDQANIESGYITLLAPKGGKTVSVPVSAAAMEVLRGRERAGDFVFPGRKGGRRYEFSGPWRRILKAARIEGFRFHDFRHNFASQLASAGVSIGVIQQLMTHKQIQTTMKYAHLSPGALQDAARRSADLITKPSNVIPMEGTGK